MLEGEGTIRGPDHLIRGVLGHVQILVMCPHASKARWRKLLFAPGQTSGNSNPAASSLLTELVRLGGELTGEQFGRGIEVSARKLLLKGPGRVGPGCVVRGRGLKGDAARTG